MNEERLTWLQRYASLKSLGAILKSSLKSLRASCKSSVKSSLKSVQASHKQVSSPNGDSSRDYNSCPNIVAESAATGPWLLVMKSPSVVCLLADIDGFTISEQGLKLYKARRTHVRRFYPNISQTCVSKQNLESTLDTNKENIISLSYLTARCLKLHPPFQYHLQVCYWY